MASCMQIKAAALVPNLKDGIAVDLCCGLGGLSLAAQDLGFTILAGIDSNTSAIRTYSKNFPGALAIHGSVRSKSNLLQCSRLMTAASKTSIVLSGPPCQGFSIAGSRDPKDSRNKILLSVARAIAYLQPTCALVENVVSVLNNSYRQRLDTFKEILKDSGFEVTQIVLNAVDFGVAQKRARVFFLITKHALDSKLIALHLSSQKTVAKSTRECLHGLPSPALRPEKYNDELDEVALPNHYAMRHSESVKEKIAGIFPGTGPMSYRRLHPDRPANTLFSGHRAPPAHFAEPRSITVREAARLQGFPDTFRVYGRFGSQMEQVTNAVPIPLARAAMIALLNQV